MGEPVQPQKTGTVKPLPTPVVNPTPKVALPSASINLMSLKPAEVKQHLLDGSISDSDAMTYAYKKKLAQTSLHDMSPQDVKKAYSLGVVKQGQVDDYIDRRQNPISYHIKDIFGSASQGVTSAIDETAQTAEWFAKNGTVAGILAKTVAHATHSDPVNKGFDKKIAEVRKPIIGTYHEPKTTAGEITKGVTQFLTGFIPAVRGAEGVTLAKDGVALVGKELAKAKVKKEAIRGAQAGVVADSVVFDEHDKRLSNLIQESPTLANPVTDYLKANPGDSLMEGKLKNAIEGLGLGVATEALFMGVKQVKNLKLSKHNEDMGDVAQEIDTKFPTPGEPHVPKAGKPVDPLAPKVDPTVPKVDPTVPKVDPTAPKVDPTSPKVDPVSPSSVTDNIAQEAQIPKPEAPPPGALYDESTHLVLHTSMDQTQAQDLANAIVGRHGATDSLEDPGVFNQSHMDMLHDTNTVKDIIILTSKTLDTSVEKHVDVAAAAKEMGMDEATLLRTAQKMAGDTADASKVVTAMRDMMLKYGNALAEQTATLVKRIESATDPITTAERLQFVDNLKMFQSIQGTLKGITTNTARAVSAGRINVNGKSFAIDDMSTEDITNLIGRGQKDGFAEIDDLIKMFHSQKTPEARARMAGTMHGKGLSGLVEYYQAALLSSPTTHLTNTVSNAANIAFDEVAGLMTNTTTASKYRLKGLYRGALDGLILGKKAFLEEAPQLDKVHKMSNENGETFGNFSIKGTKGKVIRSLSFRPMLAIDEFFKNMTYRAELTSLAYEDAIRIQKLTGAHDIEAYVNKVVSAPNRATHLKALEYSRKMTFQEEFQPRGAQYDSALTSGEQGRMRVSTGIDSVLQGFQQKILNEPNVGMLAKLIAMPFYQTPINLLKAAGRMTPGVNLLSKRYMQDIKAGGFQARRARAKTALGTSVLILGSQLYTNGDMVGGIDKDMQKIAADNGVIPYSVFDKDGGKLTLSQLLKMDPFITLLGLGADYAKALDTHKLDNDPTMEEIGSAFALIVGDMAGSTWNMTVNKAFMKSLKDSIDAFSSVSDGSSTGWGAFKRFAYNKASGFVPFSGLAGYGQEQFDEFQRNILDLHDALYSRVNSTELIKKYNALGEPRVRPGRNFIAGQQTVVSQDPVLRELLNVKVNMTQPSQDITVRDIKVELNKEQYDRYNQLIAQPSTNHPALRDAIGRVINDPRYAHLQADSDRADKIQNIISSYRDHARNVLVSEFPELQDKVGTREGVKNAKIHEAHTARTAKSALHWMNSLEGKPSDAQTTPLPQ